VDLIELLKVIVISIIQGITEWLPVSSTGHMILAEELLNPNLNPVLWSVFLVVVQFGSILAVVVLFWEKIFPFKFKGGFRADMDKIQLWFKILVACLPAAVIGILFDDTIEARFFNPTTVAITLIGYGILFIIIERQNRHRRTRVNDLNQITYRFAFLIGIFQLLALIPGTSRSGATIIGGLLLGASRFIAAEFTFFLAIPVMFGASLLRLLSNDLSFTAYEWIYLGAGTLVAFIVSILAIKFLLSFIKRNDFTAFGWYRIALGLAVIGYFYFM